jgi:hypothetical protein
MDLLSSKTIQKHPQKSIGCAFTNLTKWQVRSYQDPYIKHILALLKEE